MSPVAVGSRPRLLPRVRVALAVLVLTATSVAWNAVPPSQRAPGEPPVSALPFGLGPQEADASFCATPNPAFTGRLTANSASTTAISRTTTGVVSGYISNVDDDWACTLYFRYDGLAWNTTGSVGNYAWGNLINSQSVACNWAIGSTDYLKANSTADCPDYDAEYAMSITLDGQGMFQANAAHTTDGDFSFVHNDCGSYYGGQVNLTGKSFVTTNTDNRPGANCDTITIDATGTTQSIEIGRAHV